MPHPDFVMLGNRAADGRYAVYASVEVERGDLIREQTIDFGARATIDEHFEMTAHLRRIVVGYGGSYAEALANLLKEWSPPVPAEITADTDRSRRSLEGAP